MNMRVGDIQSAPSVASMAPGECAQVSFVAGGRTMTQRMAMLGIRPGVQICVLHGPGGRGAVLRVGGARIALGRGVIERILIAEAPAGPAE